MSSPTISIIIPLYNVELYIEKCLHSVLAQTFTNFEVILVNDGSTDTCKAKSERIIAGDSRFTIVEQENKGLSAARNTGLKEAKGEYVFYLDSDDCLVENAFDLLINAAVKYQADVVQGNFYYDYPNYLLLNKQQTEVEIIYTREEAMFALLEHKTVLNFAWGKLIKTHLAKKHEFPEGKFYEDTFWKAKIIHDCNKYIAIKQPILYYLQRTNGISGNFSIRNLDQLDGEISRLEFLKKHYPELTGSARKSLKMKLLQHSGLLKNLQNKEQDIYLLRILTIEKQYSIAKYSYINRLLNVFHLVFKRISPSNNFVKIEK